MTKKAQRTYEFVSENCNVDSNCNSICFYNKGVANVEINGFRLEPFSPPLIFDNDPEVLESTRFGLSFDVVGSKTVLIERKYITIGV